MAEIKTPRQGSYVNKTIAPLYIKIVFINPKDEWTQIAWKKAAHLGQNDGV